MDFKNLFKRKLAEQQEVAYEAAQQQEAVAVERTGVLAEFEPKLKAIVLEAFDAMREVKWPMAQVLSGGGSREPTGVTAYAFSRFGSTLTRSVNAEVVIDSHGKLAFNHSVSTVGEGSDPTVASCYPLDLAYERLLATVQRHRQARGADPHTEQRR